MKYSQNLPKINYTTTIGDFNVVDLSSYFTLDKTNLDISEIEVSKSSTLVELASSIYNDVDWFWLFMYANDTSNPFTTTKQDNAVLQTQYAANKSIQSKNSTSDKNVYVPAGSIIYPKTSNSGACYDYGSTGNFSLTGGFALIQSYEPYSKTFTAIDPYAGITFAVNNPLSILINGPTGYYYYQDSSGGVTNYITYINSQAETEAVSQYIPDDQLAVIVQPIEPESETPPVPLPGTYNTYTYSELSDAEQRKIKYFLPYSVGYLNMTKIVQNYSV
jgi:hypothetical protein